MANENHTESEKMLDNEDIKILVCQRGNLKMRLTKLCNWINSFVEDGDSSELVQKQNRISLISREFELVQNKIELLSDDSEKELDYRDDFENQLDFLSAKVQQLIERSKMIEEINYNTKLSDVNNGNTPTIRLPVINLKNYSGDFREWYHFKDIFESLILNNKDLSNIQRFQYLLSCLHGEPHELIKNIPITDANFENAYQTICQRYGNKRLIVANHIKSLLELPTVHKNDTGQLRQLINAVKTNVDAIYALDTDANLGELLLIQMILANINIHIRIEFESSYKSENIITLQELLAFLEQKSQTNQLIQNNNQHTIPSAMGQVYSATGYSRYNKPNRVNTLMSTNASCCSLCRGPHKLHKCMKYLSLTIDDRLKKVKEFNLCINCLRTGHMSRECSSNTCCFNCQRRHHTTLHYENTNQRGKSSFIESNAIQHSENSSSNKTSAIKNCYSSYGQTQVLLATALVNVSDEHGNKTTVRCVLDNGSMVNFASENLVQSLHLKRFKNHVPIESFNNMTHVCEHAVNIQISSLVSSFSVSLNCNVVPTITSSLPATNIDSSSWEIPRDLVLADPGFNKSQRVDLLLGAQVFMKILLMERLNPIGEYPILQNSEFDWLVSGEYQDNPQNLHQPQQSFFIQHIDFVDTQLEKFWRLENVENSTWSIEEKECENHFIANTTRDDDGSYIVKLPLKQELSTLGESRSIALERLLRLERRLASNEQRKIEYHKCLDEYVELGHMRPAPPTDKPCYYMPHHAVFKEDSTSTKFRIVFDGSCETTNNLSLNSILMTGPVVQDSLFSIILRFRTQQIAFIADISKMYRRIKVHPSSFNCQRILWRKSTSEPVQEYELTTVTYGTSAAPYLATRCLQQLAEDEKDNYSETAIKTLKTSFYVDDLISGMDHLDAAIEVVAELRKLLASGNFELRKFSSNCQQLLQSIPSELHERKIDLNFDGNETVKALGLRWQPDQDKFRIISGIKTTQQFTTTKCTKRKVLSIISTIFDPLGNLCPTVTLCKMQLQKIWKAKLQWDDNLPLALESDCKTLLNALHSLNDIEIDRVVIIEDCVQIQLHGFSDASELAYGGCVYIRSVNSNGQIMVKLLCAKSRVAPLKRLSIPRLELCGALLISRLINTVRSSLNIHIDETHLWTDSSIVLAWLKRCPSTLKTFISHRISEIQESTRDCEWHHVKSHHNPADLVSRGMLPDQLTHSDLWWHGAPWLKCNSSEWPIVTQPLLDEDIPELKQVITLMAVIDVDFLAKFSTLSRLQRKIAYSLRFVNNCRREKHLRDTGPLSVKELKTSLHICLKVAQRISYSQELLALENKKPISKNSKLLPLHPFIDSTGLLRVGGRLQNSKLPFETKHQIILSPKHHLTHLIIENEHKRLLHAGSQLLIGSLRCNYWIPTARKIVRSIIHKCIQCFRFKREAQNQLMGNLPSLRVQPARPFLNTGVDYAGPIFLKTSHRSKTKIKAYVCVFICFTTRAVHLELASDLSTESFLAALRRFVARRGNCANIYSDNGTNFVGASRQLRDLYEMLKRENTTISENLSTLSCQWHFIPPSSPHMGGLWESAVKSMKHHFHRIVANSCLDYEQTITLLAQIEATLNSRPLCKLSDDPFDLTYLTPGHFLIGEPLTSLPDPDLSDIKLNRLDRWQYIQRLNQQLWQRWSADYLCSLQQRPKWTISKPNIELGSVVLVKEDNLPPLKWKLGKVELLHPGSDGVVRVASVLTDNHLIKRSITKLCQLPSPKLNYE